MSAGTLAPPAVSDGSPYATAAGSAPIKPPRRKRPTRPTSVNPTVVYVTYALRAFAVLTVWLLLYAFVFSSVQEQRIQAVRYHDLRSALAAETVPITAPITVGLPIGLLNIPAIGVHNSVFLEGTSSDVTMQGPGHERNTVLPGQTGVSVLMGRSVLYGAPFGSLKSLRPGDLIAATTGQGIFNFKVLDVRHVGDPVPVPLATGAARLVLETSSGSAVAPTSELYVDANLIGKPAIAGAPAAIDADEAAMKGTSGQLSTLLLWLEGLLLVALATVWARHRWGRWQSWLVGLPALLALLWGATASAALLLPNLL